MIVAGIYSFKGGREVVETHYAAELNEIRRAIALVDPEAHRTKASKEKTMPGKMLYNPRSLNRAVKEHFAAAGWRNYRVPCEYSSDYYTPEYKPETPQVSAYREMDFIKNRLGVEVQFGKYACFYGL